MTQFLPPNLLALFAPRDPIPYKPPLGLLTWEKDRTKSPYSGVGQFIHLFEDVKDTPPPTRGETKAEKKKRRIREKSEKRAAEVQEESGAWDPHNDPNANSDAFKTLFISRINYDTSESKLRREFEMYGKIKKIHMVKNVATGKSRGYAFVEYEKERDMHAAYKSADGKKIDGRRVLVDVERGRTVKGWKPRRLGGGLGSTRAAVEDGVSLDRDRNGPRDDRDRARVPDRGGNRDVDRGANRDGDRGGNRDGDRGGNRDGDRGGNRDRDRRDRRDRDRSDRDRDRSDRDRPRDRDRDREKRRDRDKDRRDRDKDRDRKRDDHKSSRNRDEKNGPDGSGDAKRDRDGDSRHRRSDKSRDKDRRERRRDRDDKDRDRSGRDRDRDRDAKQDGGFSDDSKIKMDDDQAAGEGYGNNYYQEQNESFGGNNGYYDGKKDGDGRQEGMDYEQHGGASDQRDQPKYNDKDYQAMNNEEY